VARKLTPQERALWSKVADTTNPWKPGPAENPADVFSQEVSDKTDPPKRRPPIEPFEIGTKVPASRPLPTSKAAAPTMDKKTFGKMRGGKLRPEARLDLHGMTLDQAQPALIRFVMGAQSSGKRLILVITGKGKDRDEGGPIPTRRGILRQHLPIWCKQPPLNAVVLELSEAHLKHGGGGAFYLYLRRPGKSGSQRG